MTVSIIIPTKNREQILFNSLEHTVKAIEDIDVEILIINDGDKELLIPVDWMSKIRVIKSPGEGVAAARNLGAKIAASDLLIFMDDDILINEHALKKTIELANQYPDSTININWIYPPELLANIIQTKFGRYLDNHGFTSLKGWNNGQPWNAHELFQNIGITSQFLAIHKHVFNSVNGYDETFPHAGFEDYDFAKRLRENGVHFYIWPKDSIFHNETDRHELNPWLQRKRRGGETRKNAVLRGHQELELHYSGIKKMILLFLSFSKDFWICFLNILPNYKWLDGFYGMIVNALLATYIFEGYTKMKR
ncbi:MAG: b-glycosyltransferase, glycosyltransferase family 2 protein [Bacteroidota bacterium]|nr:b-glycosyltransferase, glycosyltransferase family 2 protein [Bacteroidota bacterium]